MDCQFIDPKVKSADPLQHPRTLVNMKLEVVLVDWDRRLCQQVKHSQLTLSSLV
jgi:hypothetical protein